MKVSLPLDCGNAPRITIVGEFVAGWAKGDTSFVADWLAEDSSWAVIGEATHRGLDGAVQASPRIRPERVEILSIATHGRLASCDGYLEAGGRRINFSHMFRFAGAAKTAKIAELRSYIIESSQDHG